MDFKYVLSKRLTTIELTTKKRKVARVQPQQPRLKLQLTNSVVQSVYATFASIDDRVFTFAFE